MPYEIIFPNTVSNKEADLFLLPLHKASLAVPNPVTSAKHKFEQLKMSKVKLSNTWVGGLTLDIDENYYKF